MQVRAGDARCRGDLGSVDYLFWRSSATKRAEALALSAPHPSEASHTPLAPVTDRLAALTAPRLLIADDIEMNRDLLRRRLGRLGLHNVQEAENGRQALEIIRSERPDLVLLDIMMPIMTGFDVLETMASEGLTNEVPVIVISAMNEMASTVRAIELGAVDFLLKPFDPTLLRARVQATLEKKQLRDAMLGELVRKQAELAEARSLQMALVPPNLIEPWGSIEVLLQPALEVGGDLVDYVLLADGRRLLALGDVSGKGAGAALMMARCHALIRTLVTRADASQLFSNLGDAAAVLNTELALRNDRCLFVTLLLAVFDPATGELDYVRCGHIPPFVRRTSGALERLDGVSGLPLGLVEEARFSCGHSRLAPGDTLLLLSDGVTEAASPSAILFEEKGVADWLACGGDTLDDLISKVRTFEMGLPPSDDLCALLLKRAPSRSTPSKGAIDDASHSPRRG